MLVEDKTNLDLDKIKQIMADDSLIQCTECELKAPPANWEELTFEKDGLYLTYTVCPNCDTGFLVLIRDEELRKSIGVYARSKERTLKRYKDKEINDTVMEREIKKLNRLFKRNEKRAEKLKMDNQHLMTYHVSKNNMDENTVKSEGSNNDGKK